MPQTAEMRTRVISVLALLAATALVAMTQEPSAAATHRAAHHPASDWPQYHHGPGRSGRAVMKTFHGGLHVVGRKKLDGAVYGQPLVINGNTYVTTENNTVYKYGPRLHLLWKRHLGAPSPQSQRPCGDIDPLGITATPLFSYTTDLLYVAAEIGGSPPRHRLFAINPLTGKVRFNRSVDLSGVEQDAMQMRGALALSGGRVWVSFGALAGDCGNYKGRVVGVPMRGRGKLLKYQPSGNRQGGIWNASGPTVDGKGHLYLVSANGSTFPGDKYDHTNSVNEIGPKGHLVSSFAPANWAQNNQGDVGLGSQGVALVGKRWAVLGGKSGPVYVLHRNHLGGIGGAVTTKNICPSYGGAAVYKNVMWLPCVDGVRAVRVGPAGGLHVLWHTSTGATSSPSVGGGVVWTLDADSGVLHGLRPNTGRQVASANVGQTNRFATPTLSGHRIMVGTLSGLVVLGY
jgi:hypothetical protein